MSALSHLEDAEVAILSYVDRLCSLPEDPEEEPDALSLLFAVLRSISRAAGALEEEATR